MRKEIKQEDIWDAEAAQNYDTPGTGMFAPEVLNPTVNRLAELAQGGRTLEFAIGTGRVAIPLAAQGVPVAGIEYSQPMVDQLRTKVDEATIPVVVGDMAAATAGEPGEFQLVYLVFNAISTLLTQAQQVACFRNAARHLAPGGRFVIELWVPEVHKLPPNQKALVGQSGPGFILLDTYDVLNQTVVSHHFSFEAGDYEHAHADDGSSEGSHPEDGTEGDTSAPSRRAHLFRSPHRYVWPSELDLMAQLAGLELESRHADWQGAEFTADSPSHVSVYRLPEPADNPSDAA